MEDDDVNFEELGVTVPEFASLDSKLRAALTKNTSGSDAEKHKDLVDVILAKAEEELKGAMPRRQIKGRQLILLIRRFYEVKKDRRIQYELAGRHLPGRCPHGTVQVVMGQHVTQHAIKCPDARAEDVGSHLLPALESVRRATSSCAVLRQNARGPRGQVILIPQRHGGQSHQRGEAPQESGGSHSLCPWR